MQYFRGAISLRSKLVVLALASIFAGIFVAPTAKAADCSPTSSVAGAYTILKFTTVGSCTYALPSNANRVEYLIVGGGGGGGNNAGWGGGGGSYTTGLETQSASTLITVTIGDGGAGGTNVNSTLRDGQNGNPSSAVFAKRTITANGGTGGQTYWSDNTCNTGSQTSTTFSGNGGAGGAMGVNGSGGTGGAGYSVTVTPSANIESSNYEGFAGGGGGGVTGTGAGGIGTNGGSNGGAGNVSASGATSNTGGGGGGGGDQCKDGGKGGSGIVILRYLNDIPYPNVNVAYPTVTGTLSARYLATNFNGLAKTWADVSSNKYDITDVSGSPYTAIADTSTVGNSASNQYAVTGITTDKFKMPFTASSTYTTFYVARYTSPTASNRRRILSTDAATNWLSGFYSNASGISGVAFHGVWITQQLTDPNGTSPFMGLVISTDQQALHRSQRVDQTSNGAVGTSQTPLLAVNNYNSEVSDWQILEMIVYSTQLSASDIQAVENYLYNQYFRGVNYSALTVAAGKNPQYRIPTTLNVSVRTQSRVTFKINGKVIPGCNRILSTSTTATCRWLPSQHTQFVITSTAVPVNSNFDATTSSASVNVVPRTNTR